MTFIYLLLGMIIGGVIHGFKGAILGGALGVVLGLILKSRTPPTQSSVPLQPDVEKKLSHLQKSLEDIHWRLERIEKSQGLAPSPMMQAAAEAVTTAPVVTPAIEPEPAPILAFEEMPPPIPAEISTLPADAVAASVNEADTQYRQLPEAEKAPSLIERLLSGNIVAKLGVVILIIGVGFLLKFAYDRSMFPPEMRLLGVVLVAGVMMFLGKHWLESNRTYATVLIGGAVGLLYVDVFFALKTFALIGAPFAFALFLALGVAMLTLAVRLDARALAVLALIGAFLAPILASTGSGNHVLLFSYYLLLNLIILAVSWFKAWRSLNFTGFLFTFVVALMWGNNSYTPELFSSTEPFLFAYFLLYLAIPILFATRQPPQLKGLVDGTLVFGMPLSAAMLQAALTQDLDNNILAWSAAIVAAIYALLSRQLKRREGMQMLSEAHLALALVFGTIAPYFAFESYPTFAFWTLEGAAIFWIGCRQERPLARGFSIMLQLGAAFFFLSLMMDEQLDWRNQAIGCGLIALASWITARCICLYQSQLKPIEIACQRFIVAWGCLWWLAGGVTLLDYVWPSHGQMFVAAMLIFTALSTVAWETFGVILDWSTLRRAQVFLLPVMVISAAWLFVKNIHPFAGELIVAWPFCVALLDALLKRQERDACAKAATPQHIVATWLLMFLLIWEALWQLPGDQWSESWRYAAFALVVAATLGAVSWLKRTQRWPVVSREAAFRLWVEVPLFIIALTWTFIANLNCNGDASPWVYQPILNPLDLAQLAVFAACWFAYKSESGRKDMLLAIAAFWWINGVLIRSLHQWADIPFEWDEMLASTMVQAALSLLWTSTALVLMLLAGKRDTPSRPMWMMGATLLGIVVLKLALNDLGHSGTVARIVSFIGVGVLLLVIGYVAPVPPSGEK